MGTIDTTYPTTTSFEFIELTPAEYLSRFQAIKKGDLETIEILPPALGSSGFGKIRVRIKGPVLRYPVEK